MKRISVKVKGKDVDIHIPDEWVGSNLRVIEPKVGYRPNTVYVNGKKMMLPSYTQWNGMVRRCDPESAISKNRIGGFDSTLSESFRDYNNYMDWAEKQIGFMEVCEDGRLFQLDKDIIGGRLRYYSEETCCFVPHRLNGAFSSSKGFNAKRKMISDFIDNHFNVVSDDVVDSICMIASVYSLNLADWETVDEFKERIKFTDLWYKYFNTKLEFDAGISFTDGRYKAQIGKVVLGYFNNPYDANKVRLEAIYEFFGLILEDMSKVKYSDESAKTKIRDSMGTVLKMLSDVENRSVKLKEWVLK